MAMSSSAERNCSLPGALFIPLPISANVITLRGFFCIAPSRMLDGIFIHPARAGVGGDCIVFIIMAYFYVGLCDKHTKVAMCENGKLKYF